MDYSDFAGDQHRQTYFVDSSLVQFSHYSALRLSQHWNSYRLLARIIGYFFANHTRHYCCPSHWQNFGNYPLFVGSRENEGGNNPVIVDLYGNHRCCRFGRDGTDSFAIHRKSRHERPGATCSGQVGTCPGSDHLGNIGLINSAQILDLSRLIIVFLGGQYSFAIRGCGQKNQLPKRK